MAKAKLTDKTLKDNPLGEVILQIQGLAKQLSSVSKHLEGCFVTSLETSEPIVDPFLAKSLVSVLESDQAMTQFFNTEALSRLKLYVASECRVVANSFEARLRPFCKKNNISVEGRFPTYVLAGFLQVGVEQVKGVCKVGGKPIKSLMLESVAPAIIESLKSEVRRPFEISAFLKELYESYERVIRLGGLNTGQPVQILAVFRELVLVKQPPKFRKTPMKAYFQDYTRDLFSRDLAKVVAVGPNVVNGKHMEFTPTAFPHEDGLPIRKGESVRYVGRLAFTKVVT